MVDSVEAASYGHTASQPESESYLYPHLLKLLRRIEARGPLFEIGAGAGWTASSLTELGFQVTGVEPSADGVALCRRNAPRATIHMGSAYDDLAERYGRFPVVYSLEVIEHLYSPRLFVRAAYDLLEEGGHLILSTPYHGYWKNLALALTGKLDDHFTALWDHGHIKFWSERTLRILLAEGGFEGFVFTHAGRRPPLSKSLFVVAVRR